MLGGEQGQGELGGSPEQLKGVQMAGRHRPVTARFPHAEFGFFT